MRSATKNVTTALLLIVAMLLLAGCSPKTHDLDANAIPTVNGGSETDAASEKTEDTSRVILIGAEMLSDELDYPMNVEMPDIIETWKDEALVGTVRSFEFAGKTYELEYECTRNYLLGEYCCDVFNIEGSLDDYICFLRDGSVMQVFIGSAFKLDFDDGMTGDEICTAVKEFFGGMLDLDAYEKVTIRPPEHENYCYDYCFTWYNEKGGVKRADSTSVTIMEDGTFVRLLTRKDAVIGLDAAPDDLTVEEYYPDVQARIREIYGDDLKSFTLRSEDAELTVIDGRFVIYVPVEVVFDHKGADYTSNFHVGIFING